VHALTPRGKESGYAFAMSQADDAKAMLRVLLLGRKAAALGTVDGGRPFVSMTPYAIDDRTGTLLILVSSLAAHTRNLRANRGVSILVMQAEDEAPSTHEIARATIDAEAVPIERGTAEQLAARDAYLARFPEAEPLTGFGDFSFFALRPLGARVVAGFARARTLDADEVAEAIRCTSA